MKFVEAVSAIGLYLDCSLSVDCHSMYTMIFSNIRCEQGHAINEDMYKYSFGGFGPVPTVCSVSMLEKIFKNCRVGKANERRGILLRAFEEQFNKKKTSYDHQSEAASEPSGAVVPANPSLYKFWVEVNRSNEAQYAVAVEKFLTSPCIQRVIDKLEALDDEAIHYDLISLCSTDYSKSPRVTGHVYAAWNPLFADLIKIGATTRQPHIRVAELSSAGVPEPFQLIASVPSSNPFKLEREIHKHFAAVRKYGRNKEFFTLARTEIVNYFEALPVGECLESAAPKMPQREQSTSPNFKQGVQKNRYNPYSTQYT